MNNKKKLFIVSGIALVLITALGITYAWLTTVLNGTKVNKIKAGTLELVLDDTTSNGIDLQYAVPQTDSQGLNNQAYTFKVINNGSMNAEYKLYLEDEEIEGEKLSDSNIKYNLVKKNESNNPKLLSSSIVEEKRQIEDEIITGGETNEYELKLWIDSEATKEEIANKVFKAKIKLEAVQTEKSKLKVIYQAGANTASIGKTSDECRLENGNTSCSITLPTITPIEGAMVKGWYNGSTKVGNPGDSYTLTGNVTLTAESKAGNEHIKAVYTYAETGTGSGASYTGCLGGAEAGCASRQIEHSKANTYPAGTIIKYEVKPGVEKYFNVIKDNGTTLTMQQRENTVADVWWSESGSTNGGPDTVLAAIESATSSWSYVNNQTYSIGNNSTTLGMSGCTNYNNCNSVAYSLTKSNVKARIISMNEAVSLNCTRNQKSCKRFMSNYTNGSVGQGETSFGTDKNKGYWIMNGYPSSSGWYITHLNNLNYIMAYDPKFSVPYGARAVVVVNK